MERIAIHNVVGSSPKAAVANPDVDHERAWTAVSERDRAADGSFVFAVETTGIYCRPSCPARRPRRENVRFFASAAEAEREGFRACLRCTPRAERAPTDEIARRVQSILDEAVARGEGAAPTLEELGRATSVSPFHLQRVFVRAFGVSPRAYVEARRAARFKERASASPSVLDAAFHAGYGSSRAIYDASRALGMTPGAYRRGGAGERVAFTITPTAYGLALVAASTRGVVKVALGDREAALERDLRLELPEAEIVRDDRALAATVGEVLRFAERASTDVALDLRGTAFELRVWDALRRIPPGETRSYSDVARELGAPTAARAVARACAKNPAALVVPCHRVVGKDGALRGYRWGAKRKRALLDAESR
jgi:AraC family transcriptional regulator, regulatory protein of adaptative response / methylated-DNA-[protein]-cysteine methyltransferase